MLTYRVDDMTCRQCASAITKAVQSVDAGARLQFDLEQHLVAVESTQAEASEVAGAIAEAGYTPVPVERPVGAQAPAREAGCCGCCGGA